MRNIQLVSKYLYFLYLLIEIIVLLAVSFCNSISIKHYLLVFAIVYIAVSLFSFIMNPEIRNQRDGWLTLLVILLFNCSVISVTFRIGCLILISFISCILFTVLYLFQTYKHAYVDGQVKLISVVFLVSLVISELWLYNKVDLTGMTKNAIYKQLNSKNIEEKKTSLFQATCELITEDKDSSNRDNVAIQKTKYLTHLILLSNNRSNNKVAELAGRMAPFVIINMNSHFNEKARDSLVVYSIKIDSIEHILM